MEWFQGTISEAISQAKVKGALFCVVILGSDESSKTLERSLESSCLQSLLRPEDVVAIRLTANSQEHQQFGQIYKNASPPSIFCIDSKGGVAAVMYGSLDEEALKARFCKALKQHKELRNVGLSPSPGISSTNMASQGQSQSQIGGGTSGSGSMSPSSTMGMGSPSTDESQQSMIPLEERIEKARMLAAAKAAKKAEEEAEELRRQEIERRGVGKGVTDLKRWQEEQEAKRLVEERKKDKQDELQLRKRLREQIAQDRLDRQARINMTMGLSGETVNDADPAKESTVYQRSSSSSLTSITQARLQFRLPGGSSHSHSFEPETTLGQIRQYLINDKIVPYKEFSVSVAYPRKEFTAGDNNRSLRELGLLPSAALLIIPLSSKSILSKAVPGHGGNGIFALFSLWFGYILYPVTFIFSYIQRALPSSGAQTGSQTSTNPGSIRNSRLLRNDSVQPDAFGGPSRPSGSGTKGSKTEKKGNDGNVHRLRTTESDSDDEATWNGNSTQQM